MKRIKNTATIKLADRGWNNIKNMLEDWKDNPESNYSDKERFFKQWFEAFIADLLEENEIIECPDKGCENCQELIRA